MTLRCFADARRSMHVVVMRRDQAFQLLDPDTIAGATQQGGPRLGRALLCKPRTTVQYSVSTVIPVIRNNSVHVQLYGLKEAILDLRRDRRDSETPLVF